jgi:hypothetical protein
MLVGDDQVGCEPFHRRLRGCHGTLRPCRLAARNPYSSRTGFVGAVLIQALVVWGLWRGSAVAWYVAMFFALGMIVTIPLMDPPPDVGVFLILVLSVMQAAILWTRDVRAFVDRGGRAGHVQRLPYWPSS